MPKADRLCRKFSASSFVPLQSHLHSTLPKATIVRFADSSSLGSGEMGQWGEIRRKAPTFIIYIILIHCSQVISHKTV